MKSAEQCIHLECLELDLCRSAAAQADGALEAGEREPQLAMVELAPRERHVCVAPLQVAAACRLCRLWQA